MKKLLLILLVLRVAAPLGLAGYMWMRNRGKDVSSNFDKIVRGDIYVLAVRYSPRDHFIHCDAMLSGTLT